MLKQLLICALAGLALSACTAAVEPSTGTSLVRETSDTSFHTDVLSGSKPVFVDFYATWCQPCKRMSPVIDELATEYSDRVKFVRIDVDKNEKTAAQLGVEGLPTFAIFKNGTVIAAAMGVQTKEALSGIIDKRLQ